MDSTVDYGVRVQLSYPDFLSSLLNRTGLDFKKFLEQKFEKLRKRLRVRKQRDDVSYRRHKESDLQQVDDILSQPYPWGKVIHLPPGK